MAEPVEFKVHRAWILLDKVGGVGALGIAGFALASPWLDPTVSVSALSAPSGVLSSVDLEPADSEPADSETSVAELLDDAEASCGGASPFRSGSSTDAFCSAMGRGPRSL